MNISSFLKSITVTSIDTINFFMKDLERYLEMAKVCFFVLFFFSLGTAPTAGSISDSNHNITHNEAIPDEPSEK